MAVAEYVGIQAIQGPFILVEGASGVGYGDLIDVRGPDGRVRHGRAVQVSEKAVLVQVFSGTSDLIPDSTRVRFLGRPLEMTLSPQIVGRTFTGLGEPRDDCGPVFGGRRENVNGQPLNPMARKYPRNFIHTGISAIDTLMTLIRGQKLPIFSGNGLPHNRLAVQIATQSRHGGGEPPVVFAARHPAHTPAFSSRAGEKGRPTTWSPSEPGDDPVIERIATPRMALTAAEYLAYELGMHVLVILTDITNYCEALRELGVAAGEVPSRKGYPAYLYSDLASLYERAGVVRDREGSVTQIPILSMPNDDITHPIPDLTGFITEGQIVLSRDLDAKGIYPPIDVLTSLSRLMKDGIGKNYTRPDHPNLASQLFASYSRVQEVRSLAGVVGEEELSRTDKQSLAFGKAFEDRFLRQGSDEDRDIAESLDLGWDILRLLPRGDLTRVTLPEIQEHLGAEPSGDHP
jgi:V/A-type H+-transporting ATPase subunit B